MSVSEATAASWRELSSVIDLSELLGNIASTMRDLINYDALSILLVDWEAQA